MCAPPAIAIGSSVLSAVGQIAGASAQDQRAKANQKSAVDNLELNYRQLDMQEVQTQAAAVQKIRESTIQSQAIEATANAAAADAGVSGASVAGLQGTIQARESGYQQDVKTNLSNALAQLELRKEGAQAQAQDEINRDQPTNPLATGIGLAGDALKLGGDLYSQRSAPGGSRTGGN